ncbi:MAG TPA: inorganic phosphate transporter [Verrucomicrobia bacterium]|nr:inorganic phosphate transporter [Verrucomicrobiota bacterium]HOB32695.1 inorganic phosphate transporter [Verrucomicrobiota bacterium]HOP96661.1 inorganic phosphate transporter [Verrucomicrobiota bacterium]HPU54728.1 inorganic phosphate transporter [Verrucomicrobiota bacterium]
MTLILTVILVALIFEYINGFHDTANSIATVVSTKVLSPRQAVALAAVTNLIGALWGTAVAKTIASGLVDTRIVTSELLVCALLGAIIWNLITWYFGLPSSSSHALVGGLCGASLSAAYNDWGVLIWSVPGRESWWQGQGLLWKVLLPMVTSPLCGFVLGLLFMTLLYFLLRKWRPITVNRVFGRLQLLSASYMGFSHGTNDAQKTMGIIALALLSATTAGTFENLPGWLHFLKTPEPDPGRSLEIAAWIKVICALTMAAGTAAGGWRIIKTLGHKMVKLHPVHGFAAEATGASVLLAAAHFGMPVSTTHAITTSIMGVGCAKRFSALKLNVVERILWAWVLTIPASGLLAYLLFTLARAAGLLPS